MRLIFAEQAWEDYLFWQDADPKVVRRIHELIKEASRHPFEGLGKPEPLRHALAGYWSRRITQEHRMVYRISGTDLLIAQLRYHY
jgi:toxin YoeB